MRSSLKILGLVNYVPPVFERIGVVFGGIGSVCSAFSEVINWEDPVKSSVCFLLLQLLFG